MADSANYTKVNATPKKLINGKNLGGRIRIYHDTITVASGDTAVNFMPFPYEAKIVGGKVVSANLGGSTTFTLSVGGTAVTAAIATTAAKVSDLAAGGFGLATTAETAVTAAVTGTAAGVVDVFLYYVAE